MGERGPVPKRSEARRRRNRTEGQGADVYDVTVDRVDLQNFKGHIVEAPEPNEDWHPMAKYIWDTACESGQRIYFEPTDWAILGLLCDQLTQQYRDDFIIEKRKLPMEGGEGGGEELIYGSKPLSGQELQAFMKGFASLGLTEGDRRRMRIELERGERKGEQKKASVTEIRKGILGGGR